MFYFLGQRFFKIQHRSAFSVRQRFSFRCFYQMLDPGFGVLKIHKSIFFLEQEMRHLHKITLNLYFKWESSVTDSASALMLAS